MEQLQAGFKGRIGPLVLTLSNPGSPMHGNFIQFRRGLDSILDSELVNEISLAKRVFFTLACELPLYKGSTVCYPLERLCKEYSVKSRYMKDALKVLKSHDIIREVKKDVYMLCPALVWSGKLSAQYDAITQWNVGNVEEAAV